MSYFYGKSRGIKEGEKLKITIYEKGKKLFDVPDITVDASGKILAALKWDNINQKLPMRTVHAVVADSENKILYEGNKVTNGGVVITKKSALLGLAEYKSAVLVKKSESSIKDNKNGICEAEAKVRAFMRMLRIGEGTQDEGGYKRLFGHRDFTKAPYNKDFSTHPQIYIPYHTVSTSAARAYQIMYDTFKGLNGYYKDANEVWHYTEKNNRAKLYNINSFNQEAQDKYCVAILKHIYISERKESFFWKTDRTGLKTEIPQRRKFRGLKGDIVQLIIDDNLEKAILLSSLCWSSLPNSPYGQQDPNYTFADAKKNYDDFLKKELAGKSDLYLKKGFLKEFGYSCCSDKKTSTSNICGKLDVDLTAKLTFRAQTTVSNCTESCKLIVRQLGVEPEGATERSKFNNGNESYYQLVDENEEKTQLLFHTDEIANGMKYLDDSLDAGYALVVGVNHTLRYRRHGVINEDTTDHYVVIVGRVCENNQLYYQFWDVGSRHGDNKEYRFKLTAENHLISEKNYRSDEKVYTVTQIRRNIKNNKIVP